MASTADPPPRALGPDTALGSPGETRVQRSRLGRAEGAQAFVLYPAASAAGWPRAALGLRDRWRAGGEAAVAAARVPAQSLSRQGDTTSR